MLLRKQSIKASNSPKKGFKRELKSVSRKINSMAFLASAILLASHLYQIAALCTLLCRNHEAVIGNLEEKVGLPKEMNGFLNSTVRTRDRYQESLKFPNGNVSQDMVFHLVHTTTEQSFNLMSQRSIESIFFHHPNALIILHVKNMTSQPLQELLNMGYNLQVQNYNPKAKLRQLIRQHVRGYRPALFKNEKKIIESFIKKIDQFSNDKKGFWYSNESNLMRMLLMFLDGGIYLDTDTIVVRSMLGLPWNSLGYQDSETINGAVMKFHPGHPFIGACLEEWFATFKNRIWGMNGPSLLTRVYTRWEKADNFVSLQSSNQVHIMPPESFYFFHWKTIVSDCFEDVDRIRVANRLKTIKEHAVVVHLNNQKVRSSLLSDASTCSCLLNSFCVVTQTCSVQSICEHLF